MTDITAIKKRIEADNINRKKEKQIIFNIEKSTPFLEIEGMKLKGIKHGFSSRLGGVSSGIYESMNLGLRLDDERDKVIENYRRLSDAIGIDYREISCPDQQHHANVLEVTEKDAGNGIITELTHFDADAQITDKKGVALVVYSADCVPILFADPVKKVIASAHAGWRGTVAGIAAKTVEKMQERYGSDPADIRACIGPSIGPSNYEVDDTVIKALEECRYIDMSNENISKTAIEDSSNDDFAMTVKGRRDSSEKDLYRLYYTVKTKNRYMLDLWSINELILYNAGVSREHIYNTRLCTMDNHDIFFSHRYTGGKRGLNAGIIALA
ncbi:peptidoglycan editing factor PgeF [Lachnospiraceae bacterium C1.1]|nr:peptidoglycan editing factor PgeF [Lachnospiraceae bacterium C1.1]